MKIPLTAGSTGSHSQFVVASSLLWRFKTLLWGVHRRRLVATLFCASLFLTSEGSKAANFTWDGGGADTLLTNTLNWNPDGNPFAAAGNTAIWDGSTVGNVNATYNTDIGNTIQLHLAGSQTSNVTITNSTAFARTFRLAGTDSILIDSGAGAFTLGALSGTANVISLGIASATNNFTNNSSNTATLGSNVNIQRSGGTNRPITFNGSGNWDVRSAMLDTVSALNKSGSGTLLYSGTTTTGSLASGVNVTAGTMILSGTLNNTSSVMTVGDSSNLTTSAVLAGGSGTGGNGGTTIGTLVLGAAAGNTGASIRPGNGAGTSAGTVLNSGGFTITANSGAHLDLQVGRTAAGASAASNVSDRLNVTGGISLDADLKLSLLTSTGYTLAVGDVLYLVINDGVDSIAGTFDSINGNTNGGLGWAEGSEFTFASQTWKLTYQANSEGNSFTGGNDLALLAVVPEPSSIALLVVGLAFVLWRKRPRLAA